MSHGLPLVLRVLRVLPFPLRAVVLSRREIRNGGAPPEHSADGLGQSDVQMRAEGEAEHHQTADHGEGETPQPHHHRDGEMEEDSRGEQAPAPALREQQARGEADFDDQGDPGEQSDTQGGREHRVDQGLERAGGAEREAVPPVPHRGAVGPFRVGQLGDTGLEVEERHLDAYEHQARRPQEHGPATARRGSLRKRLPVPAPGVAERGEGEQRRQDHGDLVAAVGDGDSGEDAEGHPGVRKRGPSGAPSGGHDEEDEDTQPPGRCQTVLGRQTEHTCPHRPRTDGVVALGRHGTEQGPRAAERQGAQRAQREERAGQPVHVGPGHRYRPQHETSSRTAFSGVRASGRRSRQANGVGFCSITAIRPHRVGSGVLLVTAVATRVFLRHS
ncbi:hypothetical protein GA0115249_10134 [Streptomyces sp. PpalLS-921]|nr:hypothetical protein GA0115249_10134 [Streptomyces sp. PpalLS-921]